MCAHAYVLWVVYIHVSACFLLCMLVCAFVYVVMRRTKAQAPLLTVVGMEGLRAGGGAILHSYLRLCDRTRCVRLRPFFWSNSGALYGSLKELATNRLSNLHMRGHSPPVSHFWR